MKRREQLPLSKIAPWFDDRLDFLMEINDALRNINFGRMDHLPFYETIEGYRLFMVAELTPQGSGRPPSVGHWQLVIQREDKGYELALQGSFKKGESLGELVLLCEDAKLTEKLDRLMEQKDSV